MRLIVRKKSLTLIALVLIATFTIYLVTRTGDSRSNVKETRSKSSKRQEEYTDRRGIRVIVGHYKPDDGPGINFTKDELNKVDFHPEPGAGEEGRPVFLKPHEQIKSKRLFHINEFNLVVSNKISLDRALEDVRSADCKTLKYNIDSLPRTSIIIVFHNEAWSTLLRTIHSAFNTSPRDIIKEFILVDDSSERDYLKKELETELEKLPVPARVIHTPDRVGLIKARLLGAAEARGGITLKKKSVPLF